MLYTRENVVQRARDLKKQIEVGASIMDDENAVKFIELFPVWSGTGVVYDSGVRLRYGKNLYKVLKRHRSQPDWTPDVAVSEYAKVLIPDPNVIPEWEQPSSTNPYMAGDKVSLMGDVYESTIDNNVWSPIECPQFWKKVE